MATPGLVNIIVVGLIFGGLILLVGLVVCAIILLTGRVVRSVVGCTAPERATVASTPGAASVLPKPNTRVEALPLAPRTRRRT